MNVNSSKSLKGSMKKVESDSSDDDEGAEGEYHFLTLPLEFILEPSLLRLISCV